MERKKYCGTAGKLGGNRENKPQPKALGASSLLEMWRVAIVLCLLTACASVSRTTVEPQKNTQTIEETRASRYLAAATILLREGNPLEASLFLEAALVLDGDEHEILPRLIIAQVRAGRLRSAKVSITRLERLEPQQPSIKALGALVDKLTSPHIFLEEVSE